MFGWGRSIFLSSRKNHDQVTSQEQAQSMVSDAESSPQIYTGPLSSEDFAFLELLAIEPYNHNAKKLTFALPNNEPSSLPVATALFARAADPTAVVDEAGNAVIRWYTPISDPSLPGRVQFLIKRYDNGKLTPHIHNLRVGDCLAFRGPIVKWRYKLNQFDEVGLIGGGSGITPLFQIVTHALRDSTNKTRFKLLYGNVSVNDILLRKEIDELQAMHPTLFEVVYTVDNPEAGWHGPIGYINKEMIKAHLASPKLGSRTKVFVCGPPAFLISIAGGAFSYGPSRGALSDAGFSHTQVYKF